MKLINQKKIVVFMLLAGFYLGLFSQLFDDNFSAEPLIDPQVDYDSGLILFDFDIEKNYHITDLKNNFFKIELQTNDYFEILKTEFPKAVIFGEELVFKGSFAVKTYLKSLRKVTEPITLNFIIHYQICQEHPAEMCFAPDKQTQTVEVVKSLTTVPLLVDPNPDDKGESFFNKLKRVLKQELDNKSLLLFVLAFLLGFVTSLTPCVYPVIPIIMGYIGTRSGKSKIKGFYLSLFFVLGLGIVYSILGVIAAASGSMLGASFQNPVVVIVIAAIFIIMGLSMAGLFEIPVPSSLASKVQSSGYKSEILGSLLIGGVSGIIAAPCAGPVIIPILSWISQTRNIFLGFLITFIFAMGMGVIFIIVGTFSGVVSALPKGGKWMSYIKYFFSLILIGAGTYFLSTIAAPWFSLLLWGLFFIAASIFMGLFKYMEDGEMKAKFFKFVLVLLFLSGTFMFFKALSLKYFPVQAGTAVVQQKSADELYWFKDYEEGAEVAKREKRILMIDTWADWCVACKKLEKYTFSDPAVHQVLNKLILVKIDFTKKSEKNEKLRKRFKVLANPTVIFIDSQGNEIERFFGYLSKEDFLRLKVITSLE